MNTNSYIDIKGNWWDCTIMSAYAFLDHFCCRTETMNYLKLIEISYYLAD